MSNVCQTVTIQCAAVACESEELGLKVITVIPAAKNSGTRRPGGTDRTPAFALRPVFAAQLILLLCALAAQAQSLPQQNQQLATAGIRGSVVDRTGTAVPGAKVKLVRNDQLWAQETSTDADGQYRFMDVPAGAFGLTVACTGFAAQTTSATLGAGENYTVPVITLAVATNVTEVRVVPSQVEIAEEQIKEQEKQRVIGFIPNFYVSYVPDAAPLSARQKFELAWKSSIDPVSFGITGAVAGIQQAQNDFSGYGQGAQGYAKRYGASYADLVTSTFIGGAILPSLLKQDPRYFYKGTGTKKSRALYAIANSVICKGDNGHWQANYSAIVGSLASGGLSNLYYPSTDRNGAALTFENALIGIGATAAANLLQEFLIKKLTPNLPNPDPGKPKGAISRVLGSFSVRDGD